MKHARTTNVVVDSRTHQLVQENQADALAGAIAAGLVHKASEFSCGSCGGDLIVVSYDSDGWRKVQCLECEDQPFFSVRANAIEPVVPA